MWWTLLVGMLMVLLWYQLRLHRDVHWASRLFLRHRPSIVLVGGVYIGFFITDDGYILTSSSIPTTCKSLPILRSGTTDVLQAEVLCIDYGSGTALLKAQCISNPLVFCTSSEIQTGQPAMSFQANGTRIGCIIDTIMDAHSMDDTTLLPTVDVFRHTITDGAPVLTTNGRVVCITGSAGPRVSSRTLCRIVQEMINQHRSAWDGPRYTQSGTVHIRQRMYPLMDSGHFASVDAGECFWFLPMDTKSVDMQTDDGTHSTIPLGLADDRPFYLVHDKE